MASSTLATLLVKLGYDGKEFDTGMGSLGKKVAGVASIVGGGLFMREFGGYMKDATEAAALEEQAIGKLQRAIVQNTGATVEQAAGVEKWIGSTQRATNVADSDLRAALTRLVSTTGDLTSAQDLLSMAIDISAARGVSLESVQLALEKAYQGNVAGLQRLGINTKNAAGETMSFKEVMASAAEIYGGAAADAANTAAGKLEKMKLEMADLKENIGRALIPILSKLVGFIDRLVSWFNNLSPSTQKVITIVLVLVGALGGLAMIFGPLIAMLPMLGAAFGVLLGPVGLVVAAIAAVVAIVILVIKYHEQIKAALIAAWEAIKAALSAAWEWIKGIAEAVWGAIVGFFTTIWDAVSGAFTAAWDWIKAFLETYWNLIKGIAEAVWGAISGFFSAIWDAVSGAFTAAWDSIKGFLEAAWNKIKSICETVWNAIKAFFTVWFDIVKGLFTGNFGAMQDTVNRISDAIKGKLEGVWNAIKGFLTRIWDEIKGFFQGMWDAMQRIWESAATWIRDIPNKIKSFFAGAANWLVQIGRDILNGLWNGLRAIWDKISGWISDIGSKIKSGFKRIFGLGSPSKVFHSYGVNIMEGLRLGLESEYRSIDRSLDKFYGGILDRSSGGELLATNGGYGPGATGRSANLGGVVINISGQGAAAGEAAANALLQRLTIAGVKV